MNQTGREVDSSLTRMKAGANNHLRQKHSRQRLTFHSQGRHPLELGLLEPAGHPLEGLPPGLQLSPGLGVPQQVGQGALRPGQHPLGEDGLRNAVPLQFVDDPCGQVFGVDLLPAAAPTGTSAAAL